MTVIKKPTNASRGWLNSMILRPGQEVSNFLEYIADVPKRKRCRFVLCRCKCGLVFETALSGIIDRENRACWTCGTKNSAKSRTKDVEMNFWEKVNKNGPIPKLKPELGPCWIWMASKTSLGYGRFSASGNGVPAHRMSYELSVGKIPEGLVVDHLCRNTSCVNPLHLEPVTVHENVIVRGIGPFAERAKQTHCLRGHPLQGDNVYVHKSRGVRICRACHRIRNKKRKSNEV